MTCYQSQQKRAYSVSVTPSSFNSLTRKSGLTMRLPCSSNTRTFHTADGSKFSICVSMLFCKSLKHVAFSTGIGDALAVELVGEALGGDKSGVVIMIIINISIVNDAFSDLLANEAARLDARMRLSSDRPKLAHRLSRLPHLLQRRLFNVVLDGVNHNDLSEARGEQSAWGRAHKRYNG